LNNGSNRITIATFLDPILAVEYPHFIILPQNI
jgi:hypothetical protein